jgi:hypothetical protein
MMIFPNSSIFIEKSKVVNLVWRRGKKEGKIHDMGEGMMFGES